MCTGNKKIAFLIVDNGIDGKGESKVKFASWSEIARDSELNANKNKAYLSSSEIIVNQVNAKTNALAKLNGIDKLVLGLG